MSTFGVCLGIIIFTSMMMSLILLTRKNSTPSLIFLCVEAVCVLTLSIEAIGTKIKKIDVGECVVVDGIKLDTSEVEIVIPGSLSHIDIKVVGTDIKLIDIGTEGVLVYYYHVGRISKQFWRDDPVFVPFEVESKHFNKLFQDYEITVVE